MKLGGRFTEFGSPARSVLCVARLPVSFMPRCVWPPRVPSLSPSLWPPPPLPPCKQCTISRSLAVPLLLNFVAVGGWNGVFFVSIDEGKQQHRFLAYSFGDHPECAGGSILLPTACGSKRRKGSCRPFITAKNITKKWLCWWCWCRSHGWCFGACTNRCRARDCARLIALLQRHSWVFLAGCLLTSAIVSF